MNRILLLIITLGIYLPIRAVERSAVYRPGAIAVPTYGFSSVTPDIYENKYSVGTYNPTAGYVGQSTSGYGKGGFGTGRTIITTSGQYGSAKSAIRLRSNQAVRSYGGSVATYQAGSYNTNSTTTNWTTSGVTFTAPAINANTMYNPTSQINKSIARSDNTSSTLAVRRIKPNGDGSYDGEWDEEKGQVWDGEGWVEVVEGTTAIVDGVPSVWRDGKWQPITDQADPDMPIGDTPWWLMTIAGIVYILRRKKKRV